MKAKLSESSQGPKIKTKIPPKKRRTSEKGEETDNSNDDKVSVQDRLPKTRHDIQINSAPHNQNKEQPTIVFDDNSNDNKSMADSDKLCGLI